MTPEEKAQLNEVYQFIQLLKSSATLPVDVERSIQARGFYKTFPPINHNVTYAPGTLNAWVAASSGGAVTTQLIFEDGILKQLI